MQGLDLKFLVTDQRQSLGSLLQGLGFLLHQGLGSLLHQDLGSLLHQGLGPLLHQGSSSSSKVCPLLCSVPLQCEND